MGTDEGPRYLCSVQVDQRGLKWAREVVRDGYVAEWIVDNLPGATSFVTTDKTRRYYVAGFKMGDMDISPGTGKPRYFIHNHVTLVVRWHRAPGRAGRRGKKVIVGFEVHPRSIEAGGRNETGLPADIYNVENGMELRIASNSTDLASKYADSSYVPAEEEEVGDDATLTIPYTYSVYFLEDENLEWQNRWDMYLGNQEESSKIHWLAIVNSLVISGLLTSVVAVVVTRAVRGDIKGYRDSAVEEGKIRLKRTKSTKSPRESLDKGGLLEQSGDADADGDVSSDDEALEDITGWKLVHGDIFRPPAYSGLLAPIVGSGTQLVFVAAGLILLGCFGVLNPSVRGGYINCAVALFIIAGVFSGYFSGRVYKTFGGQQWQKNVLVVRMPFGRSVQRDLHLLQTGILIPGLFFATVFVLNLFVWAQAASTAVPFGTLVGLVALWLLIQLPLVYVGSWYGYTMVGAWGHPIKVNAIPRQIPQPWWRMKSLQTILVAGLIPFAVIFIELLSVFKSLWQDKSGFYYVFGFTAVVGLILIVTVVEITIVATYLQLCSEVRSP